MSRREPKVRRIVVTLEPDSVDTRLVQNAARLARAYDAELVGLFVKVQELLDLADLPFSRTVVSTTGTIQQLDRGHMDSALEQLARKARQQLSEQAEQHQVQWSFQTRTGHCEEVVAGIATANDLVALAPGPAGSLQHPPAITVTHAALARAQSVTVMYEGDSSLLAVAHRFADSLSAPLTIMITAADATERARLRRNAQAWLRRHRAEASLQQVRHIDQNTQGGQSILADLLTSQQPGLLVVSDDGAFGDQARSLIRDQGKALPLVLIGR